MERLTCKFEDLNTLRAMCSFDRESDTEPDDCDSCQEICGSINCHCDDDCPIQQAFDRLASYEDLAEQGKLLELPCKVGDTVYEIFRGKIQEYEVISIHISSCSKLYGWELKTPHGSYSNLLGFEESAIRSKVFLKKSEAEQALKNIGEKIDV